MTFGENFKALRNSRALSQKALAEALGFSFQNISKWERNESLPDIETLLVIAKFFGTTTDALLGHIPEKQFSVLSISGSEGSIYQEYPDREVIISGNIVFVMDGDGKITAIVSHGEGRQFRGGYLRRAYDPFSDSDSTLIYEYNHWEKWVVTVMRKQIRIPEGGVVLAVSDADFVTKKILKFVIPEEYHIFLNPHTYPGYYSSRDGKYLFRDILKHNELDDITVELTEDGLLFKKPADEVDPLSVNIEALAKIVRRELEKEHNRQIEELKCLVEELTGMVDENESNIDDLHGQLDDLKSKLEQLEARSRESGEE